MTMNTPAPEVKPSGSPKGKVQSGNRSPNYPQMNFAQALDRIRKVYAVETTHSVPDETIARDLGYTTLNGTSRTTLSALKKYALLVPNGDNYKVSQEAQRIIELPNTDRERVSAMRKLALRPPVYKQLQDRFPGKNLPSDSALLLFLMDNSFEKEAANQVIRFYKETLQYLEREAPEQVSDQAAKDIHKSAKTETPREDDEGAQYLPPVNASDRKQPSKDVHLRFHISRECVAEIIFLGPVTGEAVGKLIRHLELSKEDYPSFAELQEKQGAASMANSIPTSLFDQNDQEEEQFNNTDEDYSDLDEEAG